MSATPVLDAHVHLWDRSTDPQPWIDPATMAAIDRDFAPGDLERMLDATGAATAVVVQSSNSFAETGRLLAHRSPRIAGVVGWLDLTTDPAEQLDGLAPELREHLVGIRHLVHIDPDPGWLGRPAVLAGLGRLATLGLGFDLVVRWWQLPLAGAAAAAHPDLRFVVDHLGGIADTDSSDTGNWEAGLRELGRLPNMWAKVSGLAGADADHQRRAVDVALEAFGPDRLMYGSDWPVAELGAGAVPWKAAVDEIVGRLSPSERQAILSGTAAAFYRIAS